MKWTGMLVVSLRGVNFGFWSRLGCSGQNVIIFKTIKKQKPIQRRKVLNLCTIFRLAKPAFFRYNGKLHWEGFYM